MEKPPELKEYEKALLALDPDGMTEEDARQEGIRLLEACVREEKSGARADLGCNIFMVVACALSFGDVATLDADQYWSYRSRRRHLRKFRRGTYRDGYQKYLSEWHKLAEARQKAVEEAAVREKEAKALEAERFKQRVEAHSRLAGKIPQDTGDREDID